MAEIIAAVLPNRGRLRAVGERLGRAGFRWDERAVEQEQALGGHRRHAGSVLVRVRAEDVVRAASARRILAACGARVVQPGSGARAVSASAEPRRVHVRVARRRVLVVRRARR